MKKRVLPVLAAALCLLFGVTGCGSEPGYTAHEQKKIDQAEDISRTLVPILSVYMDESEYFEKMIPASTPEEQEDFYENFFRALAEDYTTDEAAFYVENYFVGFAVNGYAFQNAIGSYRSSSDAVGKILIDEMGEPATEIDGNEIIVRIPVKGTKHDAEAEFIYENNLFEMKLTSAALNPDYRFGEKMSKAALNTVIGMGTVFIMLILISLIISLFGKLAGGAGKKKKSAAQTGIEKAVAQIEAQETAESEGENLAGDTALVAVIAAAVAAYEGAAGADGFIVRSIRKVKR